MTFEETKMTDSSLARVDTLPVQYRGRELLVAHHVELHIVLIICDVDCQVISGSCFRRVGRRL